MPHPRAGNNSSQARMDLNTLKVLRYAVVKLLASVSVKKSNSEYPWRIATSWGDIRVRIERPTRGCYGLVSYWSFTNPIEATERLKRCRAFVEDCNGTFPPRPEGRAVRSRMKNSIILNQWRHLESDLCVFRRVLELLTKGN